MSVQQKKKSTWAAKALAHHGRKIRPSINRFLAKHSQIPDTPIVDKSLFPFAKRLEEKADIIAAEARAVLDARNGVHAVSDVSPDHKRIAHDKRWKSFFMIGYGYKFDHNCARCPETTKVLEQIPGLNSGFFSIMEAGAEIPPHRGVTKAFLTCHLGIQIPKETTACGIKVEDNVCHWENGKTLIFDDMFQHEAWNRSQEDRIILLIQFRRPMALPGRLLGKLFMSGIRASSFVQDGRINMVEKDKALGFNASSSRLRQSIQTLDQK